MMSTRQLCLLYLIFMLSGFSGLIYESIWAHYLKLFLGHAAYAQALVLINFMGGMALGAWLAAKYTHRIPNLLIAYALVELIIGLFGLGFHNIFQYLVAFSYDTAFSILDTKAWIHAYKWFIATLLILPPSVLLGMTFPLMSNSLVRFFPQSPGRQIAMLYFCNSIGAAIGVVVAGFYLIAKVGLPGTIMVAAILNILLAIVVYFINKYTVVADAKRGDQPPEQMALQKTMLLEPVVGLCPRWLLIAAFVTGVASFIYEIAWMRMLSMVLGSSTHAFELMLSAFITGLALGGLWIRKRLDGFSNPIRVAGWVQIAMGLLALATLPLYNYTFNLMSFFVGALDKSESGYLLFNLASHLIVSLVMLPATFFAGMTLPLFTLLLLKNDYGERSIGHIYASNTVGAIVGVVFAVFIGMPHLGLQGLMLTGTSLDLLLGIIFLALAGNSVRFRPTVVVGVVSSVVLLLSSSVFTRLDVKRMAAWVYRHGAISLAEDVSVLSHLDGSTASISVIDWGDGISIATNGKSDGAIGMAEDSVQVDETTMILTAALPLSLHPWPKSVANIGFGTGLTTHTLLLSDSIETLETIEIEPAMVAGARLFQGKNDKAFSDPRSHINIEDAKTYFHTHKRSYDMIISEPSNAWVSGVSSLFTKEFYQLIKHYLNDDGIFVQWLPAYESNIELIALMLSTISTTFVDYQVYLANSTDLIIIASPDRVLGLPDPSIFANEQLRSQLARVDVKNMHDLTLRLLGNKKIFQPYLALSGMTVNSDFFPVLDWLSSKARFIASVSHELQQMRLYFVPIMQFLQTGIDIHQQHDISVSEFLPVSAYTRKAQTIYHYAVDNMLADENISDLIKIRLLLDLAKDCQAPVDEKMWIDALFSLNMETVAYLYSGHIKAINQLITPDCGTQIPLAVTNLLGLYAAYGNRDTVTIKHFSSELIAIDIATNHSQKEFLFASLCLSLVALDRHQEGLDIWNSQLPKLYADPSRASFPLKILGDILAMNVLSMEPSQSIYGGVMHQAQ